MTIFRENVLRMIMVLSMVSFSFQMLSPGTSAGAGADQGKTLYENKCAYCHGSRGLGDGPSSRKLGVNPNDLTSPAFWKGKAPEKIRSAIEDGYGAMPNVDVAPGETSAIIDYMSKTFRPQEKK